MRRSHSLGTLAAIVLAACHGEGTEARRAEAGRIAEAIRVLRAAPNDGKRPLLRALRGTACSAEDLCLLRTRCGDGYALQISATDGIATVRRAVQASNPLPDEAAALLTRSESELHRALELTQECADGEAEIRRRYSF